MIRPRPILMLTVLAALSACGGSSARLHQNPERDVQAAAARYEAAMAQAGEDAEKTEQLLREALALDLYHGAAHNNLGVILLQRGELYESAQEFEWARKLLPGHPDPRHNLAIALYRGGKIEDAVEACDAALEVRPHYIAAVQTRALIAIRDGAEHEALDADLATIVQRGETETWRRWAQRQQLRREAQP